MPYLKLQLNEESLSELYLLSYILESLKWRQLKKPYKWTIEGMYEDDKLENVS